MRNSSLVQGFCAEDVTGLKSATEASDDFIIMVGERSHSVEGIPRGVLERWEVRMLVLVARRQVRILPAENLRFPGEGSSSQGKSGPKARPKGVVDGKSVEIPIPPVIRLSEVVTQ